MSPRTSKTSWPLPSTQPEEVGVSPERLARIAPGLAHFIKDKKVPNLVTLLARHGKIVHFEAQGYLDFESKKPANKDTIYRLWSNTKPITGIATMICVEEGLLTLDDPVSKYIPSFKNQRVRLPVGQGPMLQPPTTPVARDITVRDCLRNTTGLTTARKAPLSYMTEYKDIVSKAGLMGGLGGGSRISLRERLDALAQLPLECQPGTQFEYQVGYPIAGVVLETVTGQTLGEFYKKRILEPLGMKDSSFYLDKHNLNRFPTVYSPAQENGKWKLAVNEEPAKSEKVTGSDYYEAGGGGGGVLSTAADYARFSQMLLNKGELDGVRIISRKSIELMTSSHTTGIDVMGRPGVGFGIGVGVYNTGAVPMYRSPGSFGWSGAAGTTFFVDPKEDLFGICFTQVLMHQSMPGNTYQEEFERLVYQALM